jgi:hypothetical protein
MGVDCHSWDRYHGKSSERKIKELINLVYGKTFSEAHLHMLLENIEKAALLLRKSVKRAGMKKMLS